MISVAMAEQLHGAGLRWRPVDGDRFTVLNEELKGEEFTVAAMVVEVREHPTGTLIAFNGTTEWALDSVELGQTLWLPREDQLRELLGPAFGSLTRSSGAGYRVSARIPGQPEQEFVADDPADAYAAAVLALISATTL